MSILEERTLASANAARLSLSNRLRAFAMWDDRGPIIYTGTRSASLS